MKLTLVIGAALAAGAWSAPALAQGPASAETMAKCVVTGEPALTRRLLQTVPGSEAERRIERDLNAIYAACARVASSDTVSGRGRLALALIEKQLAAGATLPAMGEAASWYAPQIEGQEAGRDYDASAVGNLAFGDCVLRAAPDAGVRFVAATPGSAAAKEALTALSPTLGPCIPQGQEVRLTPANLRLLLAEPLYHAIAK